MKETLVSVRDEEAVMGISSTEHDSVKWEAAIEDLGFLKALALIYQVFGIGIVLLSRGRCVDPSGILGNQECITANPVLAFCGFWSAALGAFAGYQVARRLLLARYEKTISRQTIERVALACFVIWVCVIGVYLARQTWPWLVVLARWLGNL